MMRFLWILSLLVTVAQADVPGACRININKPGRQGYVPHKFYDEVFNAIKLMPDIVFMRNNNDDVYSLFASKLGPFETLAERRAVMIHVISSMAAQESTWNWNAGRDPGASNTSWNTQEAGAFQTSCNIMGFDSTLKRTLDEQCGSYGGTTCQKFVKCTKGNHRFAIETVARALRFEKDGVSAYRHWGPLRRHEITEFLTKACVAAIQVHL